MNARDSVIGDNYTTLQGLRRRCQELETHKFVLGYKVSRGIEVPAYVAAEVNRHGMSPGKGIEKSAAVSASMYITPASKDGKLAS